jgi:hypothetical protein
MIAFYLCFSQVDARLAPRDGPDALYFRRALGLAASLAAVEPVLDDGLAVPLRGEVERAWLRCLAVEAVPADTCGLDRVTVPAHRLRGVAVRQGRYAVTDEVALAVSVLDALADGRGAGVPAGT